MANQLIACETCDKIVLDSLLKTIETGKGKMKVCKKCYTEYVELTTKPVNTSNQMMELSPVSNPPNSTDKQVTAYLQTVSHVSNPESVPHPETGKKFTQEQLFAEYLTSEQTKIVDIFAGRELGEAYSLLEDRIALMESIVFEDWIC